MLNSRGQLRRRLATVVCLVHFAAAGMAEASTHVGIISTERSSPHTTAQINVASAQQGGAVFSVFPPGSAPISDTVQLDGNLFASSASSSVPEIQNLFTGSDVLTALVRVDFPGAGASAVLEQSSTDGKVVLDLPRIETAAGSRFQVAVGALQHGTLLLVGNPNPAPNAAAAAGRSRKTRATTSRPSVGRM